MSNCRSSETDQPVPKAALRAPRLDHARLRGREVRQMHPESTGGVNRRALLRMAAGTAIGAAVVGGIPAIATAQKGLRAQMEMSKEESMSQQRGGQLYMQTNEV